MALARSSLFSVVLLAVVATSAPGFGELGGYANAQTRSVPAASGGRISPQDVNTRNLEAYEAQFRKDLPVGTSKAEVADYLTRMNIRHIFLPPDALYGNDGNAFQAVFSDIGSVLGFQASLGIWIRLDATEKVREIVFRVQYL